MKVFLSLIKGLLPHLVFILSLMILTFFIIDLVNPAMAFMQNGITKALVAILSVLASVLAILFLIKEEKKR